MKFSKLACPVFDTAYDCQTGPQTNDSIAEKMRIVKELGFKRIYLVAQPEAAPGFQYASPVIPADGMPNYFLKSMFNLGDITFPFIRHAKKCGLEVFVRLKPYEGGGVFSLPEGKTPLLPLGLTEQLGGPACAFTNFIQKHPELRVKRFHFRRETAPITAVEFAWIAEPVAQAAPGIHPDIYGNARLRSISAPKLYFSTDNGTYFAFESQSYTETLEKRMIRCTDGTGRPLFPEPKLCRVIRYDNLVLPDHAGYLALEFHNPEATPLETIPFSMTRIFSGGRELDCTASIRPRTRAVILSDGTVCGGPDTTFRDCGFEFEAFENVFGGDGWSTEAVIGVARGKMEYMKSMLCEAYPEVQQHWLDRIDELLAMGADGISIRFRNHSCAMLEYAAYGANAPIVARYHELYGVPGNETYDPERIMRVRGLFFNEFYERAAAFVHTKHKKLECDIQADFADPHIDIEYNHAAFWVQPKILPDYKRLADVSDIICLDDFNFGTYVPEYGAPIKDYAHSRNIEVRIHCYMQQGGELNPEFLAGVENDRRISGIDLYEMNWNTMHNADSQEARGFFETRADGSVHCNPVTKKQFTELL